MNHGKANGFEQLFFSEAIATGASTTKVWKISSGLALGISSITAVTSTVLRATVTLSAITDTHGCLLICSFTFPRITSWNVERACHHHPGVGDAPDSCIV